MNSAWCILTICVVNAAHATTTVYARNLPGFLAAAPDSFVAVNFDSVPAGTNIADQMLGGIVFLQTGGAAPIVVNAADTVTPAGFAGAPHPETNKLIATTGDRVLSPGGVVLGPGPNPQIEDDDLTLLFSTPVKAFGFDHISQSADGAGFTSIVVRTSSGAVLYSGSIPISNLGGGGAPAGVDFWGIVSSDFNIARVDINEGDSNDQYPDSNIGFDTLRIVTAAPCPADFNQDGGVDGGDVQDFFAAWEMGDFTADVNVDGGVDGADVSAFFAAWEAGGCG
ncbi:MAG: hypothetical protein JSR77_13485 [Planctomycetes bacterium]|nr:hypothetical protein [Planctomycetota bacterium]